MIRVRWSNVCLYLGVKTAIFLNLLVGIILLVSNDFNGLNVDKGPTPWIKNTTDDPELIWPRWFKGETNDRILAQMKYVPSAIKKRGRAVRNKTIVFLTGSPRKGFEPVDQSCPVNQCLITTDYDITEQVDAIIFGNTESINYMKARNTSQVWVLYTLESPLNQNSLQNLKYKVNWTATYRTDSTIVAPYEKFIYRPISERNNSEGEINYHGTKNRHVAWFVSNCGSRNNRLQYAKNLSSYIPVDIFGQCGNKQCPKTRRKHCFKKLKKEYKFYLAFENSNCRDYITEKIFLNAYQNNIIPIVMGAPRADYERLMPKHSFIHVDDFDSIPELATYLLKLSDNAQLYNEYFRWKGQLQYVDTRFKCRLCALLHYEDHQSWYDDIEDWWNGPGVCRTVTASNPYASWNLPEEDPVMSSDVSLTSS